MHLYRYPVPTGKVLLIGHNNYQGEDFIGFVEPDDQKWVTLDPKIYGEYAENTCNKCDKYVQQNKEKEKYNETYKNMFLCHPEMFAELLAEYGDWGCNLHHEHPYDEYVLRGLLTAKQYIDLLLKWDTTNYEKLVHRLCISHWFNQKYVNSAINFCYNTYSKCKGYNIEFTCKKNLEIFNKKKIPCNHNTLLFTQSLENLKDYYIFDNYTENALALPNIYRDGTVCWGSPKNKPKNLTETCSNYFNTPFNRDLLLDGETGEIEMLEGYGFSEYDFYEYDEYNDEYRYDLPPRCFTATEIIQLIDKGGDNENKGKYDLSYTEFNVEGVREILVVENGRKIPDFAELIDEDFLDVLNNTEQLFIFLINEVEEGVWEAYLPTSNDEGEYIQINLRDLANLDLDEETEDEE